MYTGSSTYTYTSAAADADFALTQCVHRLVVECLLEGLSFFSTYLLISPGRYPNSIPREFGLNYTCGVLRSFNYVKYTMVCSECLDTSVKNQ